MPRPRVHDINTMLDAAEYLAAEGGASAVTSRAVASATGISNGAIYHAFGSRGGLVGRAWLRAANRFLSLQQSVVDSVLAAADGERGAVEAVVAAADAPALFAEQFPQSARFLFAVRRDELLADVPADIAEDLRRLDAVLVELFITLAKALWGRKDGRAVAVIEGCVVGLPSGLLLRGQHGMDPAMRPRLHAAVLAVLAVGPPQRPKPRTADMKQTKVTKGKR